MRLFSFLSILLITSALPSQTLGQDMESVVFERGKDGYPNMRIPALIQTPSGSLLAFAEGRVGGDAGDIDTVMRRSDDQGKTWSELEVVWGDGVNTCGNPAPVVDHDTGDIWLFMTWNYGPDHESKIMTGESKYPRKVFVSHSTDDGKTWSCPKDLTDTLRLPDWRWYATGPCNGIQLTRGPHKGRLIIPANHSDKATSNRSSRTYRSHIIYSDDHGTTWNLGGVHEPFTNESTVVELADGSVMDLMRSYHNTGIRSVAVSSDGGESFGLTRFPCELVTPVCQASAIRWTWADSDSDSDSSSGKSVIAFSSPYGGKRERLSLWLSYDEGKTWPVRRSIYEGPSAYSCLTRIDDKTLGVLYEKDNYQTIVFRRLNLEEE